MDPSNRNNRRLYSALVELGVRLNLPSEIVEETTSSLYKEIRAFIKER